VTTEWEQLERTETIVRTVTATYRAPEGVEPMLKHRAKKILFQPTKVIVRLQFTPTGSTVYVTVSGPDLRDLPYGHNDPAMAFFDADSLDAAGPELDWLKNGVADLIIDEHND